ncbi:hypothetical protein AAHB37_05055 [Glutamicibacter halophytocola]|uniref:alpha/beta hydrolase n=1 Tax=Glutamicibacter halophytocola TaxID=1933880 RepID=UPI0032198DDA
MTSSETAPVAIISRNDDSRLGTPLLVFLHGYGSNEQDLMGLSQYLPEEFTYLSVRAPLQTGPGYCWFPLTQEIDYSAEAVSQSVVALWAAAGTSEQATFVGDAAGVLARHGDGNFVGPIPARRYHRGGGTFRFCR